MHSLPSNQTGYFSIECIFPVVVCSCFFYFFYSLYKCDFPLDRIDLVETIPLWMDYGTNATFGVPLYKAWKDLLSTATQQVDIASFYWSLTGEDIGVKSSTDQFVSSDPAI